MRPVRIAAILVFLVAAPARAAEPDSFPYDLSKVRGIAVFPQDEGLRKLLAKNGFVVVPRTHRQIYQPYSEHIYNLEVRELPAYVTPESIFRTYQVLLEGGLRLLEKAQAAKLKTLSLRLLDALKAKQFADPALHGACDRLLAWAAVGACLQDAAAPDALGLPPAAAELAGAELARIEKGGMAPCALFPERKEGEVFPYGHLHLASFYAREPDLAAFFRAVKWYGLTGFRVLADGEARMAFVLADAVQRDHELARLLEEYAAPLDALLGPIDDITPTRAAQVLASVLGKEDGEKAVEAAQPRFRTALDALPHPRINDRAGVLPDEDERSVRLLGPRHTWESELFTAIHAEFKKPDALHVLAALGDRRATELADSAGSGAGNEASRAVKITRDWGPKILAAAPPSLARDAVEALGLLFAPPPAGAPPFAGTQAWRSFLTWGGLGSWTCLRHSWELSAKEAFAYAAALPYVPKPAGYVAPCPDVFARMKEVVERARATLAKAGAIHEGSKDETRPAEGAGLPGPEQVDRCLLDFADLLGNLARIARIQLAGGTLGEKDRTLLEWIGPRLGHLHYYEGDTWNEPRDDMPLAVLVATNVNDPAKPVERYTAVGRAYVYLENIRRIGAMGHVASDEEFEFMRKAWAFDENPVRGAEDVLIVERIKEMLLQ